MFYVHNHLRYHGFVFFFQAEDGIRDLTVTGVQTCALPIAAELLRRPRQEPRHVLERHEREVEAVAEPHEACRLQRRVDVEAPGEMGGLVRHDPDGPAAESPEPDDDVRRERRLDLEEVAII